MVVRSYRCVECTHRSGHRAPSTLTHRRCSCPPLPSLSPLVEPPPPSTAAHAQSTRHPFPASAAAVSSSAAAVAAVARILATQPVSALAAAPRRPCRRLVQHRPPMRVLCINAGSSSLKVSLFEVDERVARRLSQGDASAMSEPTPSYPNSNGDGEAARGRRHDVQLVVSKNLSEKEDPVTTLRTFIEQQEKEEAELEAAQAAENGNIASSSSSSNGAGAIAPCGHPHPIRMIVHRIVHGGTRFQAPTLLDDASIAELETLNALAPLHNPPALRWIKASRDAFGTSDKEAHAAGPEECVKQVAVFDTAFFGSLPLAAQTYALPRELMAKHKLRRYGFHGIAHEDMFRACCPLLPGVRRAGRLITMQLGSGASVAAILEGKPQDTSMGFSPLEGLVMGTRPGDIDPGVMTFLASHEPGMNQPDKLEDLLYHRSGLKGISGISGDMRELWSAAAKDPSASNPARLAIDVFVHRVTKYIGSYIAVLGGVDAICFGGGIGEHDEDVRAMVVNQLAKFLPVELDAQRNADVNPQIKRHGHTQISTHDSKIKVFVVAVDEAKLMLRDALLLTEPNGQQSQL